MTEPAEMTLRQQQGLESRERILEAAVEVIYERGYSGASVSEIRKRSGLPASSIYWHFGNKEGVTAAVLQREADRFFGSLPVFHALRTADPTIVFREFLTSVGEAIGESPRLFRVLVTLALEAADGSDEILRSIRRIREEGVAFLLGPLAWLCDELNSPQNPREISRFCLSVLDGSVIASRVDADGGAPATIFRQIAAAAIALASAPEGSRPQTEV